MKYRRFKTDRKTKILLISGAFGCWLFVLASIIQGRFHIDYDPVRHPLSSLAIGEYGWLQAANFIVLGLLTLGFSIGLRRALRRSKESIWVGIVMGLVAIGLVGAGIFITDPEYGYPVNLPLILAPITFQGYLHEFFSLIIFLGLPVACFILRHRFQVTGEPGWAAYSGFTGIAILVTFVLAGMGFKQFPHIADFAGVYQRLSITLGSIWITLLTLHLMKMRHKNRSHT
ncbi:MAG: DUF998 domain-containing protein [Candidatus Kapaibacterium sp.]